MAEQYQAMWKDLGLDLAAHDALLGVLGSAYGSIYLAQKNRPKATAYMDFVMSEVHGLRIKELVEGKKAGRKVVGTYCTFVPEEIVIAAGGVMVGLCAGADFNTAEAEKYLPRNTCVLIKSTFGFKTGRVCPYLEASDMVVGENTCDGKKKAYEILGTMVKNLYVMDLPQTKGAQGRALLRAEYERFLKAMEKLAGRAITAASLKQAIALVNGKRKAVQRLARLRAADPAPISGLDALLANQIFFYEDPARFTENINKLCDEVEQRVKSGQGVCPKGTPRILVSGCPMAVPNWKLPAIVETSGGVFVGEESCVGERGSRNLVDAGANDIAGLLDAIVDRYLAIDCAIFTPNTERLDHIRSMAKAYHADGVLLYGLQFCSPYAMEAMVLEKTLEKEGVPVLKIETDYSQEDMGQIKTRVEAFLERIRR